MAKQTKKQSKKIAKVMREFKIKITYRKVEKKVKSRKQAIAIALSQAGLKKN